MINRISKMPGSIISIRLWIILIASNIPALPPMDATAIIVHPIALVMGTAAAFVRRLLGLR